MRLNKSLHNLIQKHIIYTLRLNNKPQNQSNLNAPFLIKTMKFSVFAKIISCISDHRLYAWHYCMFTITEIPYLMSFFFPNFTPAGKISRLRVYITKRTSQAGYCGTSQMLYTHSSWKGFRNVSTQQCSIWSFSFIITWLKGIEKDAMM